MMKSKLPAWVVLTLIAVVAAVLLGVVYEITAEPIAARAAEDARLARLELAPGADGEAAVLPAPDGLDSMHVMTAGGQTVGYVGTVTETGFGGDVEITVGINTQGTLTGIRVGGPNFAETPGLGANTRNAAFTDQFAGQSGTLTIGEQVDAVTSATITSSAVVRGVNRATEAMIAWAGIGGESEPDAGQLEDGRWFGVADGFKGPVYVALTLSDDGAITAIEIGDERFAESRKYGALAREPAFYEQFIGLSGTVALGEGVDALSGATITSQAVVDAVNKALAAFANR